MNSRNHTGNVRPITTGSARALEPSQLMAPPQIKFLAEHSIVAAPISIPPDSSALPPLPHHHRMHSMGYGIDE